MSKFQSFDELIDALQGAVLKAHSLTQNQHIFAMRDYFDEDGKPYVVKIKIPTKGETEKLGTDESSYKTVEVPSFSLIPQSSLKMKKIKMDFDVKMIGLDQGAEKREEAFSEIPKNTVSDSYSGRGLKMRRKDSQRMLTNIFAKLDDGNRVHVELEFTSNDPPEGVMRVNDMLIRTLP